MRYLLTVIPCLVLLAGCQASDVSNFWNKKSIDYSDIRAAEDQFADFAELAVSAPQQNALSAMDVLFDKLKQDTVAYYIYTNWMDGAFYNMLSPCRNVALYNKAVERIQADGILDENESSPFLKKRDWIGFNQQGTMAIVPGLSQINARTLVLVLDMGCPSCREALEKLASDSRWDGIKRIAVCLGRGPKPEVPGWEYLFPENASDVFDINMTPIYFVVAADGSVESGYTLAL